MNSKPVFQRLQDRGFSDPVEAARFPNPQLFWWNQNAAKRLNLDSLNSEDIEKYFLRFEAFPGNLTEPRALRYHGHQFRHYNPDLGDGRGFLWAQFLGKDSQLHDLSTKGSGTTPFSRRGDGRLTFKGALRELLASEMLESLDVNTSQTLCIFKTGEILDRSDEASPCHGAVLTRRMHSSLRFGTFQRLAFFEDREALDLLVPFALEFYELDSHTQGPPAERLFQGAVQKSAQLAAQLMMAGFIHGVLNTDNMNITGEVFDFGPYRFMPQFNPSMTAAYFDHHGLYQYSRQPESFYWGLQQLGEALQVLDSSWNLDANLETFAPEFHKESLRYFLQRLNLKPGDESRDQKLLHEFFQLLTHQEALFEQCFFDFHSGAKRKAWNFSPQKSLYENPHGKKVIDLISDFSVADETLLEHSYFQGLEPETLLIQDIETLWLELQHGNMDALHLKLHKIQSFRSAHSQN